MKKIALFFLLVATATASALAQQQPLYSQYMYNGLAFNPAYAGSRGSLSAIALYRTQWVGVEGAPETMNLSAHMPIGMDKYGVGLNVMRDQVGIASSTSVIGNYAYRIVGKESVLSLGLSAGIFQTTNDYRGVDLINQNDVAFSDNITWTLPNFGVGAYWYSQKYFVGVSVPTILEHQRTADNGSREQDERRHYFANGGMLFRLSEDFQVRPGAMMKYVPGAPLQGDINGLLIWRDFLIGGLSLRNFDAVAPMAQIRLPYGVYAGYAYDIAFTRVSNYSSGTHEIFVGIDLDVNKPVIISPRYF